MGERAGRRELPAGRWVSLKEEHLRLAREGYVPPLPREAPFKGRGQGVPSRKLTESDVIEARQLIKKETCRALAERFGVSYTVMYQAIRGITFRHLNYAYPPQW